MSVKKPLLCERIGSKDLTVEIHGTDFKMIFDPDKWEPYFGVCDSGSSIRFTFRPKDPSTDAAPRRVQ
jgi:hypothetical protein